MSGSSSPYSATLRMGSNVRAATCPAVGRAPASPCPSPPRTENRQELAATCPSVSRITHPPAVGQVFPSLKNISYLAQENHAIAARTLSLILKHVPIN